MKSQSLRTAVLALIEFKQPAVSDPDTLNEYADALDEMSFIAQQAGKHVTADRYATKAHVLRMRAR